MHEKITLFQRSNGIYYVRLRASDGTDKWKSTGKRSKSEALAVVQNGMEPEKVLTAATIATLAKRVGEHMESNHAAKTCISYQLALKSFARIIGEKQISKVTRSDVDQFMTVRLSEVSPVTVNLQLRSLRAVFNLGVRWDLLKENPFSNVKLVRIPERPPIYLSFAQWDELASVINGTWFDGIVTFAICTGMRQGEILNLEWRHVDIARRVVHVTSTSTFRTKSGRGRIVPLNDNAIRVLTEAHRKRGTVFNYEGRPILATSLSHVFKRAVRAAGVPEAIHFHSLRHTFASWLVQDGVSLYQVGRLLGHSNTLTTEIYAHLQPETMHDVVDRIKL